MEKVTRDAHAKINLTLDVLGVKEGYHVLDSLVCTVSLSDCVTVRKAPAGRIAVFMRGMGSERIPPRHNNALKAAKAFCSAFGTGGAEIFVQKRIPVGGGLGGSSADAAGVLRALAALYGISDMGALKTLADGLGSDTGYLLTGGFARIGGRGERVEKASGLPALPLLLACPRRGVSTKKCFAAYDARGTEYPPQTETALAACLRGDTAGAAAQFCKHLYDAAVSCEPSAAEALAALKSVSPLGAGMTGSGSASFAVFGSAAAADEAERRLRRLRGSIRFFRAHTLPQPF